MRYISQFQKLDIIAVDGTVLHRFHNGTLVIGDPTLNTTGNKIPVNLSATPDSAKYSTLYSTGTDLEKAGLGKLFWEAPPIASPATNTVVAAKWHVVLSGTVIYNGTTYKAGERFLSVTGVDDTTGTGTFALDVPAEYALSPVEHNQRKESYKINHLAIGDESSWDEQNWGSVQDTNLGATR